MAIYRRKIKAAVIPIFLASWNYCRNITANTKQSGLECRVNSRIVSLSSLLPRVALRKGAKEIRQWVIRAAFYRLLRKLGYPFGGKLRQYLAAAGGFALHILMQISRARQCKFSWAQTPLGQLKRAGISRVVYSFETPHERICDEILPGLSFIRLKRGFKFVKGETRGV